MTEAVRAAARASPLREGEREGEGEGEGEAEGEGEGEAETEGEGEVGVLTSEVEVRELYCV